MQEGNSLPAGGSHGAVPPFQGLTAGGKFHLPHPPSQLCGQVSPGGPSSRLDRSAGLSTDFQERGVPRMSEPRGLSGILPGRPCEARAHPRPELNKIIPEMAHLEEGSSLVPSGPPA